MDRCAKFQHRDESSARAQLRQLRSVSGENRKRLNKLGVYHCACGFWHVGHNRFKGKQYANSGPKMQSATGGTL